MSALLEIRDLGVTYRGRGRRRDKVALDGVSVSLGAGETLGLVGESGSGKSTLGNCVLGLVQPAEGTIVFDGRDITRLSHRDRLTLSTDIQAVFQDPYSSFNPHRTIEQTVGETLATVPGISRAERRARVVAMLERVGLDRSALAKFPPQFSGGQRQRIAIARALLPEPRLVVCDESVSALDLSVQAQILNLLLELQREREVAYLFITHDLAVVRHMSTRIAVLQHGNLVEEGAACVVTEHPTQPYTRRLVAASLDADVDIQRVRRDTRRANSRLTAAIPNDRAILGVELLRALEQQAVTEACAQPTPRSTVMGRALSSSTDKGDPLAELIRLRAAILDLSSRTAAGTLTDAEQVNVDEARVAGCRVLVDNGEAEAFLARYRDLSAAIEAGDHGRATRLVEAIDLSADTDRRGAPPSPMHPSSQA